MNKKIIIYIISSILKVEGALMTLPIVTALLYREKEGLVYLLVGLLCAGLGFALCRKRPEHLEIYSRDGFVAVALSWIVLSIFGALPFVITREIPFYVDALFEIVSGFTTTGASILTDVEALSHASLFWRSFSHWLGGMGVLVFLLAILPLKGGSVMNLMRAESPGPSVSKFVPRVRGTAKILYQIYLGMTAAMVLLLLLSGMSLFESLTITFGAAGTGGFGVLNSSCADYSALQQWIITVFMILFGVNFYFYYMLLRRDVKGALQSSEVRCYFLVILSAIALVVWNLGGMYGSFSETLRQASFQVGSIMTTTGYSTTDFNEWPELSKCILLMVMFLGACAGSTGGGIKVSRVIILLKSVHMEMVSLIHPRSVRRLRFDGRPLEPEILRSTNVFIVVYLMVFVFSIMLICFDGFNFETNFTAVAATLNNIGPGFGGVGPTSNYAFYSPFAKLVLTFDMLAGRLELFPMLMLLYPSTWRKRG